MKTLFLFSFLLFITQAFAQNQNTDEQIDAEQNRIDLLDGNNDFSVKLSSANQTQRANGIYFTLADKIQSVINTTTVTELEKNANKKALLSLLKEVKKNNYFALTHFEKAFKIALTLCENHNKEKELGLLKTHIKTAFLLKEFVNSKPYAKEFWLYATSFYPADVLRLHETFWNLSFGQEVLNHVAITDPNAVKQYFGTNHYVYRLLRNSTDPVVKEILGIYNEYGMQSRAYTFIHWIHNKKMTVEDAHAISMDQKKYYIKLIDLRRENNILGNYAVEKEIEAISMKKVVEINLLHDNNNQAVRFKEVENDNAYEIYTAMVYTQEEIFTSTFLGMYERLMGKKREKSGYEFLKTLNFNRFRIFLKQCAGFNKIQDFLKTMTEEEKKLILSAFISNLDHQDLGGDLSAAIDVADTYGSLTDPIIKKMLEDAVLKELIARSSTTNNHGIKIYGLLYKLIGGKPETYIWQFNFNLPALDKVAASDLFPDGKHIQQHFFFDDDDGKAAYNSFIQLFKNSQWNIADKGSYVIIKSIGGKPIEIYANKPEQEATGQKAIKSVFEKTDRFPDLVVHRGHSYYIQVTIENMSSQNKVALLGSCGGYQNISQAMENAMDVQIISTKQIGTLVVNNALIAEMTETIRKGQDIVWVELWSRTRNRLGSNPRFEDYIPPYKNLGARFIKAYNEL